MIFNTTGGGAALNFRVVGNPQPANPTENCIWVDTDTPINSWIFSATQPSPAEPGMVWITIGKSSPVEFNALKKNGIQVYPVTAKQFIGGAWVDKTAKSWQGGAWVDWITYFYKEGNQYNGITGGWSNIATAQWTFANDRVYGSTGNIVTNNKINLSNFKKLFAEVTCTNIPHPNQVVRFGLTSTKTQILWDSSEPQVQLTKASTNKTILELPVDTINGEYYVGLSFNIGATETGVVTVYRVWGE